MVSVCFGGNIFIKKYNVKLIINLCFIVWKGGNGWVLKCIFFMVILIELLSENLLDFVNYLI